MWVTEFRNICNCFPRPYVILKKKKMLPHEQCIKDKNKRDDQMAVFATVRVLSKTAWHPCFQHSLLIKLMNVIASSDS